MSRSDNSGSGGTANLVILVIIICAICCYLLFRATLFIIRTFVAYPKKKSLWISLGAFVVSCIGATLLYLKFGSESYFALCYVGFGGLLVTCFVIDLKNRNTLQADQPGLMQSVLNGKSWWGSDESVTELKDEQLAA